MHFLSEDWIETFILISRLFGECFSISIEIKTALKYFSYSLIFSIQDRKAENNEIRWEFTYSIIGFDI